MNCKNPEKIQLYQKFNIENSLQLKNKQINKQKSFQIFERTLYLLNKRKGKKKTVLHWLKTYYFIKKITQHTIQNEKSLDLRTAMKGKNKSAKNQEHAT